MTTAPAGSPHASGSAYMLSVAPTLSVLLRLATASLVRSQGLAPGSARRGSLPPMRGIAGDPIVILSRLLPTPHLEGGEWTKTAS